MSRRRSRWAATAALFALASAHAWARVGGGHTYSGGHSSGGYSGGYSGGGGFSTSGGGAGDAYFLFDAIARLLGALINLTFRHPLIGLPVDGLIIFVVWRLLQAWNHPGYDITNVQGLPEGLLRSTRQATARARLDQLRDQLDPCFSQVAFLDFAHALYATVHHARAAAGKLEAYSGYLSEEAIRALKSLAPGVREVKGVIIGSAAVTEVSAIQKDLPIEITLEFEACMTEDLVTGGSQSWYVRERWKLARKPGVLSREPARIRQIACPACGAPANADSGGKCPACGNVVRSGDFDWYVESVSQSREQRPPLLTSDVAEEGNELPTLLDPHFGAEKAAFEARDPDFKWERFNERAALIFMQLQKAWSERNWAVARPFESDSQFETHAYWIQEYRKQKLVNVLKDIQIRQMVPVKIAQDKFYSAITLRIYASMIDCTQSEDGKLVSGSASRPRPFTEYWTFVRGKSARPPKAGAGQLDCPACGAPLKINASGICEYCRSKITAGDFDWVLSSIEQDEAYRG